MTQISRPFQIALVAVLVLFALWFAVLRGHSSSGESSSSTAAPSAQPATSPQAPAPSGSGSGSTASPGSSGSPGSTPTTGSTYHGSAPGVAGLTRAIAKARGAVTQSQQNAQRLQHKSEGVSTSSARTTQAGSHSTSSSTGAKSAAEAAQSGAGKVHAKAPVKPARADAGVPAMQAKVESQLKHGKVVAILLWNPKGSVDTVVRRELQVAGRTFGGKLAVHVARADEVGSFGTFTRAVQVYSTPTILVINPKGIASNVTGLTDAFSIEQAVREAKQAH